MFDSPDKCHRYFMGTAESPELRLYSGRLSDILQVHELVHPVSGKKAIEIEWKDGESWTVEAPTERDHNTWMLSIRKAVQSLKDQEQKQPLQQSEFGGSSDSFKKRYGVDENKSFDNNANLAEFKCN